MLVCYIQCACLVLGSTLGDFGRIAVAALVSSGWCHDVAVRTGAGIGGIGGGQFSIQTLVVQAGVCVVLPGSSLTLSIDETDHTVLYGHTASISMSEPSWHACAVLVQDLC